MEEYLLEKFLGERIVPVIGLIQGDNFFEIKDSLVRLCRESNEKITLHIDSGGGDCQNAFWLINFIKSMSEHVEFHGVVTMNCNSMAIPLLMSCSHRMALPYATFLFHYVRHITFQYHAGENMEDILKVVRKNVAQTKGMQTVYEDEITARTGLTRKQVQKLCHEGEEIEHALLAKEALSLGIIDEIINNTKLPCFSS